MKFKLVESLLEDLDSNRRALLKKFNNDEKVVEKIMKIDPSIQFSRKPDPQSRNTRYRNMVVSFRGEGKFLPWLGKIYEKNGHQFNDVEKLKIALEYFYKQPNQFENKDVFQFKTEEDLINMTSELISNGKSNFEIKIDNLEKNMKTETLPYPDFDIKKAKEGINLVYHDKDWLVYIPENYEASVVLRGQNAEWCTGRHDDKKRDDSYYNDYTKDGSKLYIIINKQNPNEKYQVTIHPDGSWTEFHDAENMPYDDELTNFFNVNDGLCAFFGKITNYDLCAPKEVQEAEFIYDGKTKVPKWVKYVKIKDDVTKIEDSTFNWCEFLTTITFETNSNLIEIGEGVFANCKSLYSISIPNSVTKIGKSAFARCSKLQKIILPNSINCIPAGIFSECVALQQIILPDSVSHIDWGAFEECKSLNSIIIPYSHAFINGDPFVGCHKLIVKTNSKTVQNYCEKNNIKWEPLK